MIHSTSKINVSNTLLFRNQAIKTENYHFDKITSKIDFYDCTRTIGLQLKLNSFKIRFQISLHNMSCILSITHCVVWSWNFKTILWMPSERRLLKLVCSTRSIDNQHALSIFKSAYRKSENNRLQNFFQLISLDGQFTREQITGLL